MQFVRGQEHWAGNPSDETPCGATFFMNSSKGSSDTECMFMTACGFSSLGPLEVVFHALRSR